MSIKIILKVILTFLLTVQPVLLQNEESETKETASENSIQQTIEDEQVGDLSDILNEILIKQKGLESIFQLILNSNEKENAVDFIKKQFDDLKKFMQKENAEEMLQAQEDLPWHDEHLNCRRHCNDKTKIYDSCRTALASNAYNDGAYLLQLENHSLEPFYAYCKANNKIDWLIIQRREDGSQDFYRNWSEYKKGFGNVFGEYWIGLERLHAITSYGKYQLFIMMEDYALNQFNVTYFDFYIGNENDGYRLQNLTKMVNSNIPDFLTDLDGMKFSTYDNDNDVSTANCARDYKGAWWYRNCYHSNLNGRYLSSSDRANFQGINWGDAPNSLKSVYMAIRMYSN